MNTRVLRFPQEETLVAAAAAALLRRLLNAQEKGEVNLCLTGGRIANKIYAAFANLSVGSGLECSRLHLWWGDERFVGTTDPDRNALQSLALLGGRLHLQPSQIHPMPASDGNADPDESAYAYAQELGDTVFDLCLLGMGPDGHVASIFPHHPSFEPTTSTAIGVTDAPKPPPERISLTLPAINRSHDVWLWVNGEEKAQATAAALAGDPDLPAAHVHATHETVWFLDDAAASLVPMHQCQL